MTTENLKQKYLRELEGKLNVNPEDLRDDDIRSLNYEQFRKEMLPARASWYEKICNSIEKIFKFSPSEKGRKKLEDALTTAHLNVTPEGAFTAAYMIPFVLLFLSIIVFALLPLILGNPMSLLLLSVSMIVSLLVIIPLQKYPIYLATTWRLKSSSQMVLCVFYLVTYMRHSSNLERAIEFAGNHLDPPLSLDLRKLLWDVENGKHDSLTDALDKYLDGWRAYNEEFVDAVHLLQSSLLEGEESRRLGLLDKSLDVVLDGTYEKMMHYAQNLKNPITTLHMLGIILPVLGLVILPLAISFIEGVKWWQLGLFYNVILPILVFLLGKNILASRPSGYGDSGTEQSKKLKKYRNKTTLFGVHIPVRPLYVALAIGCFLFLLGLTPVLVHWSGGQDLCWDFRNEGLFCEDTTGEECFQTYCTWGYREVISSTGIADIVGPYGIIASLFSLLIPLSLGLGIGIYFRFRAKNVMKVRNETKKLEKEFSTALFQLGNRLGDGLPAEIAFPKVATLMKGSVSGSFFAQVTDNMQRLGYGLRKALFDKKQGAVQYFPSKVIESSMKVLVESIKKGPSIAAQSVNNVARYIKEIHRVNERLRDLLADIISSMKQQINFLAPVISGVVVGITSMITFILGRLQDQSAQFSQGVDGAQGIGNLLSFGAGVPTYYFQIVVGVYVVQIVFILTILANSIENGEDALGQEYNLGKNMIKSTLLYVAICFVVLLVFQLVAGEIIARTL